MENSDSLLVKAIPGIVVAVVTQVALIARGYLGEQKKRRFLRAELEAEARECLSVLELFLQSIADDIPESNTPLGVGLAICIAPIRCREEYERITSSIKNALPALSEQEFRNASELKRHFRLLVGYGDACDRYFKQLQEAGHLVPGSRRQHRAASGGRQHATRAIHVGAKRLEEATQKL